MREYVIVDYSEINNIDWTQIDESSVDTLRVSNDDSKAVVKYLGDMPSSIQSLTSKEGPYSREEMLDILTGSIWIKQY